MITSLYLTTQRSSRCFRNKLKFFCTNQWRPQCMSVLHKSSINGEGVSLVEARLIVNCVKGLTTFTMRLGRWWSTVSLILFPRALMHILALPPWSYSFVRSFVTRYTWWWSSVKPIWNVFCGTLMNLRDVFRLIYPLPPSWLSIFAPILVQP